jgi:uncharacterized protein (DUF58 family)
MDMQLPKIGLVQVQDAETGMMEWIDTDDATVQYNYATQFNETEEACRTSFKRAGASLLYVRTDEDYVKILQKFFIQRK